MCETSVNIDGRDCNERFENASGKILSLLFERIYWCIGILFNVGYLYTECETKWNDGLST